MVGDKAQPKQINLLDIEYVGIKAPMFSFTRLVGADPILGVEMASTGEVATFGDTRHEAIITSLRAAGFKVPETSVFLCIGPLSAKLHFVESAKNLINKGFVVYASQGTRDFLATRGVQTTLLHKPSSECKPNVEDFIREGKIDLVINVRDTHADGGSISDGYGIRRSSVDQGVTLITDIKLAKLFVQAITVEADVQCTSKKLKLHAWDELGMHHL